MNQKFWKFLGGAQRPPIHHHEAWLSSGRMGPDPQARIKLFDSEKNKEILLLRMFF